MVLTRWLPGARRALERAQGRLRALPAYQVALWPDGWELGSDGAVAVRDTHEMAEARRWYRMVARLGGDRAAVAGGTARIERGMRLHRVAVPAAIVDLSGRRFVSERAASVAVRLAGGDWVARRREALLRAPERALALRARCWSGSRHRLYGDAGEVERLLETLLGCCRSEGLLPSVPVRVELRAEDGYGLPRWRCRLLTDLPPAVRGLAEEALRAALVPWNRTVVRDDGAAFELITLRVIGPRRR